MHFLNEKRKRSSCPKEIQFFNDNLQEKTDIRKIDAPPVSRELKKRWSYFIRKVYETDPLVCPKCQGEMRIISFIDQPDVKELTFDPFYSQLI